MRTGPGHRDVLRRHERRAGRRRRAGGRGLDRVPGRAAQPLRRRLPGDGQPGPHRQDHPDRTDGAGRLRGGPARAARHRRHPRAGPDRLAHGRGEHRGRAGPGLGRAGARHQPPARPPAQRRPGGAPGRLPGDHPAGLRRPHLPGPDGRPGHDHAARLDRGRLGRGGVRQGGPDAGAGLPGRAGGGQAGRDRDGAVPVPAADAHRRAELLLLRAEVGGGAVPGREPGRAAGRRGRQLRGRGAGRAGGEVPAGAGRATRPSAW